LRKKLVFGSGIAILIAILLVFKYINRTPTVSETGIIIVENYNTDEELILKSNEVPNEVNQIISIITFNDDNYKSISSEGMSLHYVLRLHYSNGEKICNYYVYDTNQGAELIEYLDSLF